MRGGLVAVIVLGLIAGCGPSVPPYELSQVPGRVTVTAARPLQVELHSRGSAAVAVGRLGPGQQLALVVVDGRLGLERDGALGPVAVEAGWTLEMEATIGDDGQTIALHPAPLPPDRRGEAPVTLTLEPVH